MLAWVVAQSRPIDDGPLLRIERAMPEPATR